MSETGHQYRCISKNLGQTRQNFYKKLQRDTLTLTELKQIAKVLDANFEQLFRMPDGTKFSLKSENKNERSYRLLAVRLSREGQKRQLKRLQE